MAGSGLGFGPWVEAGLAEAVILGQVVAEDQADLEETEGAKVVVIMTVSKNSCLP